MNQTVVPISITQSLIKGYVDGKGENMSAQDIISYCARISNPSNQDNFATSEKLLDYLVDHKHWSPFEMSDMTMEINTTRDISRQVLRHRSFSFQEFSQRYADPTKDLAVYMREARLQDKKNRQASIEINDVGLQSWWDAQQKFIVEHANRIYKEAVGKGIAKEQARAVLPEGNMQSRLYMKGNVRSWVHYCQVRCDESTQKEHRQIATMCADHLIEHFPFLRKWYDELPKTK